MAERVALPLSRLELRVLRAVDEHAATSDMLAQRTHYGRVDVECALRALELYRLVNPNHIERTGATFWRITQAGVQQLVGRPVLRLRAGRQRIATQLVIEEFPR